MKRSRQLEGHIRIADLRHKVVIKRITSNSANALGHLTPTTSSTTVQARIRMKQMDEQDVSDKQTVVQTPEIVIRYITPLTVRDWIEIEGVRYDITSIDAVRYHKRFLIINTKAVL